MASTTPAERPIPSRPTTPLRPPSRTSLRASQSTPTHPSTSDFPLHSLEPLFSELSDGMADLEANMMHLHLLNESISRFNESFGSLLYGLNMSAFCVDFPEAPIPQSFNRQREDPPIVKVGADAAGDATFLTTDTSFVDNPPTSVKASSKFSSVPGSTVGSGTRANPRIGAGTGRGGVAAGRGPVGTSGIARGTSTRGARSNTTGRAGSGIARGIGRGGRGVK